MKTNLGSVAILSVGAGDTTLSFDPTNPAECVRAARIVRDMLRRGYALLVEVGKYADGKPKYARALDFREDVCSYVIADLDSAAAAKADEEEQHGQQGQDQSGAAPPTGPTTGKRRRKLVPAADTRAVSVGRIAGG